MLNEKKYFPGGSGNFDDAPFALGPNDWINMENCRIGSTDAGEVGTVESIGSTLLIPKFEPVLNELYIIGHAVDEAANRFCYFLWSSISVQNRILCYDKNDDTVYTVLEDLQVTGGLNFDKNSLIHSARIINGLLYWTDNLNQPRRINIDAGIKLNNPTYVTGVAPYENPLSQEVITIIRKPPVYPLAISKQTDATIDTNLIKNNAFRFSYRYIYRDGEISTLAPHSLIANYNYSGETFNSIIITVDLEEVIEQDVEKVELVVFYVLGEQPFVIKTWDKANSTEAQEIEDHNTGVSALMFEFANDSIGEALDSAYGVKPFDSVPLLSESLEQATNRLFLSRNLLGYDTPLSSSLTAEVVSTEDSFVVGQWFYQIVNYSTSPFNINYYFIYFSTDIDGTHPAGYYDLTTSPLTYNTLNYPLAPIGLPIFLDLADLSHIATDVAGIQSYITANDSTWHPTPGTRTFFGNGISFFTVTVITTGTPTNVTLLKTDSNYRLGVVFYDQYLRQSGVVRGPLITTPDRGYSDILSFDYGIQWNLATGAQPAEIPDWAYYYSIVMTKSLRTSYFVQALTSSIVYATKDVDGNYEFTSLTYDDTNAGIAVKTDILVGYGMGYTFQENDQIKIYLSSGTIHTLAVIDQSGDWVIGELKDLGSLVGISALFEIFTPRPQSAAELFYEVGTINEITNPGESTREYSDTEGVLPGDIYLLTRDGTPDYVTEAMSPSTTIWQNWFTSHARIQIIDRIGQQQKETSIKWSNTFIPGTITNGLSTFDALDEKILPGEMGPLRKLQITSKVQNEPGAVMLAICEDETASLYLGEQQLVASATNAFIATSTNVIGTVNILKGSFGTTNPESVTSFRGNVFWVDVQNGKVIQYSLNGLFPVSNYKMTRYWKLFCEQYASMSAAQIEALGSRPFIFTAVDPHHWELLITVPKTLAVPPKGYLPDYPSMIYPFDIWDGQSKTLVYKLNREPNFWQGAYSFTPQQFIPFQNDLYSCDKDDLYIHNQFSSYNQFYGVQYKSRIMFVANQQPNRPKSYNNQSLESNMVATLAYFYNELPIQQASDLVDFDYDLKEGVYYAIIYRNKLIPTATGMTTAGLLTAEKMRGIAMFCLLEFTVSTIALELRFVNIGYSLSRGHTT